MSIFLLLTAFFAGILTVLAPCTLPLLPIIIGGASASEKESRYKTLRRALIIVLSLTVSVFVFTIILRVTTALLGIPQSVWSTISGLIVIFLGLHFIFPGVWAKLSSKFNWANRNNRKLYEHAAKRGTWHSVLTGAALGPVFNSCSPTYALIIALIFPRSFAEGVVLLTAYVVGMGLLLLFVAYFGSRLTQKLGWTLDEKGAFRRVIGLLFLIVGLGVLLGLDKTLQTWLLDIGAYDGSIKL